ncbi:MAG: DUF2726 domain-containing protein [Alphaproteobacteria bacterium]
MLEKIYIVIRFLIIFIKDLIFSVIKDSLEFMFDFGKDLLFALKTPAIIAVLFVSVVTFYSDNDHFFDTTYFSATLICFVIFAVIKFIVVSDNNREPYTKKDFYDDQQYLVAHSYFKVQYFLNNKEFQLLNILDDIIEKINKEQNKKLRVFAQTSLGEVLDSPRKEAYYAINSKRVDFLIVDLDTRKSVLAIEFNGSGHYNNYYKQRDKVKQLALEKARISFLGLTDNDLKNPNSISLKINSLSFINNKH